ncbi:hypothetical protein S83_024895 [Arachis hypogaea]
MGTKNSRMQQLMKNYGRIRKGGEWLESGNFTWDSRSPAEKQYITSSEDTLKDFELQDYIEKQKSTLR